jgi:hypothetical protein
MNYLHKYTMSAKEQDPGNPSGWLGGRFQPLTSYSNHETHLYNVDTSRMKIISSGQRSDFKYAIPAKIY